MRIAVAVRPERRAANGLTSALASQAGGEAIHTDDRLCLSSENRTHRVDDRPHRRGPTRLHGVRKTGRQPKKPDIVEHPARRAYVAVDVTRGYPGISNGQLDRL